MEPAGARGSPQGACPPVSPRAAALPSAPDTHRSWGGVQFRARGLPRSWKKRLDRTNAISCVVTCRCEPWLVRAPPGLLPPRLAPAGKGAARPRALASGPPYCSLVCHRGCQGPPPAPAHQGRAAGLPAPPAPAAAALRPQGRARPRCPRGSLCCPPRLKRHTGAQAASGAAHPPRAPISLLQKNRQATTGPCAPASSRCVVQLKTSRANYTSRPERPASLAYSPWSAAPLPARHGPSGCCPAP